MPQSYDGDYVGHTISIVGWNDNLNRYRFSNGTGVLPQNNGAWLVRNSWGDNNTMGGYSGFHMRISTFSAKSIPRISQLTR